MPKEECQKETSKIAFWTHFFIRATRQKQALKKKEKKLEQASDY